MTNISESHVLAQNPKRSLYEELTKKFKGQDSNKSIFMSLRNLLIFSMKFIKWNLN